MVNKIKENSVDKWSNRRKLDGGLWDWQTYTGRIHTKQDLSENRRGPWVRFGFHLGLIWVKVEKRDEKKCFFGV